ncbi:hypothetical protein BKA60DRAFT_588024 [Fusarium oxysporum]|nr:hypothetical protein BKA60DRAFT_588024 [Fusarium oxysporum]
MVALSSSEGSSYFIFSEMEECHSPSQLAGGITTSHLLNIQTPQPLQLPRRLVKSSAEHAWLPQFQKDGFFVAPDDGLERRPDLKAGDSYYASSGSPELGKFHERAEVSTAIDAQPWRNIGYLSHSWKEEEIMLSWKYVTSRRGEDPNSARLENACWRTWTKYKNNLKTVSPETLNWQKNSEVSWLYGPVQQGASKIYCTHTLPVPHCSRAYQISSLPQQATPVAQVRQKDSRRLRELSFNRAMPMSHDTSSMLPSLAYSGISSPGVERKHIHFNYEVEQCIAVEVKYDDDDDDDDCDISTDTNSEDGIIMKLDRSRKPAKEGNSVLFDRKTIAMLPSTTLKHREHVQVPEMVIRYTSSALHSHRVSPFSPQEASRPPKGPARFSENLIDADTNSSWYTSGNSLTAEPAGMRRTQSGMLIPYGEAVVCSNKGMFCRVIDTVKTVRDMAYVI